MNIQNQLLAIFCLLEQKLLVVPRWQPQFKVSLTDGNGKKRDVSDLCHCWKKKRRLTFNKALAREFSSHPSSCRTGKIEPSHLGRGLPPWKVMHAQLARRVVKRKQTTPARYKGMKKDGILNVGVAKKLLVVKMSGEAKNIHCVSTCFSQVRLCNP